MTDVVTRPVSGGSGFVADSVAVRADDRTARDRDQTANDREETWSDHEAAGDRGQRSADEDQKASDEDFATVAIRLFNSGRVLLGRAPVKIGALCRGARRDGSG
jgi:hypothetical protein